MLLSNFLSLLENVIVTEKKQKNKKSYIWISNEDETR